MSDTISTADNAIETDGLTKQYGTVTAVSELKLSIGRGEVYGFLGPNGAGKTTTMRLLTTLTEPTAGTGIVAGVPVTNRAALTERIGYLPAEPPVFDELTGREYLRYIARLRELDDETATGQIEQYLDRFELSADNRRIEGYSTGMQKKLGVIGAVLHDPDVLFLDEPTSGLDPRAARTMRETIAELAEQEMTVFLSTHVLPIADELADTIGVIHDGKLVAEGPPTELTARSADGTDLESVFLELTREDDTSREANYV
ncbi:MAG: ABC-type multidrug transport system, ATPase component [halophilic archaeon J07HX5]|nr:MAG: ABC-type multidrug transport system, ATPase component [halophilic archaeon J07HX5]